MNRSFDDLVREAESEPIEGWDFTWLDGRAIEDRPAWRYAELVAARSDAARRMLDVECGTAERITAIPRLPALTVATEGWLPNIDAAARNLRSRGAHLVIAPGGANALPFVDGSFDLVTSRHPVETNWSEIARVLEPGGTYLSQQVGPATLRELRESLGERLPDRSERDPERARTAAMSAGLEVLDLRSERPATVFFDIGAVVYFLRLVVWIVPDFSVERYRERLLALHERIEAEGRFVAHAARFLIEAKKAETAPSPRRAAG